MAEAQIRQTAYKVWIADIINGEYTNPPGEWEPSYIQVREKRVSRVNIVANVVSKYQNEDSSYISLTIDDGSDNVQLKAWNEDTKPLEKANIGDTILTISRVRQYNDQIYLVPEIVRKLEKPEWLVLRKKELISEYGERKQQETTIKETTQETPQENPQPVIEEETIQDTSSSERQKLLNIIEEHDEGEGVEIHQIVEVLKMDEQGTQSIIQDLLKEGEIFEIKPGKVKLIE